MRKGRGRGETEVGRREQGVADAAWQCVWDCKRADKGIASEFDVRKVLVFKGAG